MKTRKLFAIVTAAFVLNCPFCWAGTLSGSAETVLGQNDFTHGTANILDARGIDGPNCVCIDTATDRVYVSDTQNNRVLWWNGISSLTNGKLPDGVLGQADYYSAVYWSAPNTLQFPLGLAVDGSGNLWVADSNHCRVLRYDSPITSGMDADIVLGQANFYATDSGASGATASNLNYPASVALDGSGNLWVADTNSSRVLRYNAPITSGMDASVVLGQADFAGNSRNRDGGNHPAVNTLAYPFAVSLDGSGNLWVNDSFNMRILKYAVPITSGMDASIVLGQQNFTDGSWNASSFTTDYGLFSPYGLSIDGSGSVWVAEDARILKYAVPVSSGMSASVVLGQKDFYHSDKNMDGPAAADTLSGLRNILFDTSGNLWAADGENSRILRYTLPITSGMNAGLVLGQADYFRNSANYVEGKELSAPEDVAIDTTTGRIYAADAQNNRVLWWDGAGSLTNGETADGALGQSNLFYTSPNRAVAVSTNSLNNCRGVAVDGSGNVWVADCNNHRVLRFDSPVTAGMDASVVLGQADFAHNSENRGGAVSANTLRYPSSVAVDGSGNVWVSDSGSNRVLMYRVPVSSGMDASVVVGQADFTHNASGGASPAAANLYFPYKITVDGSGSLWVADTANNRVLEYAVPITSGMDASVVLGQADFIHNSSNRGGSVSGNGLSGPYGVSADSAGNIWVADTGNSRVLRYNTPVSTGMAANVFLGGYNFPADNSMYQPLGVLVDGSGGVWVADGNYNRILEFEPLTAASITPDNGKNNGVVNITNLAGSGFAAGVSVKLMKAGKASITATSVNAVNPGKLTCSFNLSGAATGYWNVVIAPGGLNVILQDAFEITATPPAARVYSRSVLITPSAASSITVNPETGDNKVEIPAYTFAEALTMTLSTAPVPSSDRAAVRVTGLGAKITADRDLQPAKQIVITINYRESDLNGMDETKLAIARYDEANLRWIPLPSTPYPSENKVTAVTDKMGLFALVMLQASVDLSAVRAFPNPFRSSNGDQGITIDNLTADASIKIYTLGRELVRTIDVSGGNGRALWDTRNADGEKAASGIYVAVIKNSAELKKIMLAVIR